MLGMPVRLALGRLVLGHPLLAAGHQLAQLVEVGAVAGADEAAVAGRERAVVDERLFERPADVGAQVEPLLRARCSSALARPVSFAFTFGKHASVRPTNARSRGDARPVVTRASSRWMS